MAGININDDEALERISRIIRKLYQAEIAEEKRDLRWSTVALGVIGVSLGAFINWVLNNGGSFVSWVRGFVTH